MVIIKNFLSLLLLTIFLVSDHCWYSWTNFIKNFEILSNEDIESWLHEFFDSLTERRIKYKHCPHHYNENRLDTKKIQKEDDDDASFAYKFDKIDQKRFIVIE
jgi:hypothetical protein